MTRTITASDTTPPAAFVSGLKEKVKDAVLVFSVLATDNADGDIEPVVKLNAGDLDGSPAVDDRNYVYTAVLDEGVNTITIDASDLKGNSMQTLLYSIIYDPDLEQELNLGLYGLIPTLKPGDAFDLAQLTLEGYDQYGNLLDISGKEIVWNSTDPAVSIIDGSLLLAVGTGYTRIYAAIEGIKSNKMQTAVTGVAASAYKEKESAVALPFIRQ